MATDRKLITRTVPDYFEGKIVDVLWLPQ